MSKKEDYTVYFNSQDGKVNIKLFLLGFVVELLGYFLTFANNFIENNHFYLTKIDIFLKRIYSPSIIMGGGLV